MKQIRLSYLIPILALLLSLLLWKIFSYDKALDRQRASLKTLEEKALEYSALKKRWKNPAKSKKFIDSVVGSPKLKSARIETKMERNLYLIKFASLNARQLDYLVNTLMNSFLKIESLHIERSGNKSCKANLKVAL